MQFIVLVIFVGILLIVDFMFLTPDTFVYDPVNRTAFTQGDAEQGGCSVRSHAAESCTRLPRAALSSRIVWSLIASSLSRCVTAQNYKSWGIKTGSSY